MPPKKKNSKSKKAKLREEQLQREEEERAAQREALINQENKTRSEVMLTEKVERTEIRQEKDDAHIATMISKKQHQHTQARFTELSKTSQMEKTQLEKQVQQLTRAKDQLEKEVNDLKVACKAEKEELGVIKKKLEGEMNSRGNCFVCVECGETIYKDKNRQTDVY
eukprot:TRINITY_DN95253_c0_g1_i1.p1 TRINITY_DN95253_c0_g1~~TRINITY_DN95253_c0_g1_i1.p1  ORF type:complete len:166 (-),score=32.35 TRINITY_DN95253_c0_g1_i1:189-686(-)